MKTKEDIEIEEMIRLIEEEADIWLAENELEFEDIDNPIHPFRFEYAHEALTSTGTTRFKKWTAE